MKKFVFSLQRVADWYRQTLSVEEAELSRIRGQILDLDRLSEALHRRRREEQAQVQDSRILTGRELQSLAEYSRMVGDEIARLQPARTRLSARMTEQQRRVVLSHRRVRTMDELEQQRRQEWLREFSKEEESLASEVFLAARARNAQDTDAAYAGRSER